MNKYISIDMLLKPFLNHVKSFVRDSLDFLNKCPRNVDEDTEIVTLDVISLYTIIPHEFGLEAINYFFTKYQEELSGEKHVLELAKFILKSNTLTFDSEFCLQ